ncbi:MULTISPECIES: RsmD family RNA methyltransferase [Butyricimonas]|uniref:RsmD family RNA methyltransferase n=1 Tax=Butyricimonas TaxID=574697 RepID=UPI001D0975E6|nr:MULTISPECIES: RsmD family RNA methyltransferase [Butyricimonas]MCB6972695.1 23S rRNA (adenine(2030)-N(6))-methyltransferase RlmJ [Butyricimonas synergistica]MCG4519703.1 23S rRNA (adenine(2030)-N(6))-methyltransferase RlmJ [Butyricimonas sp. DFI.6.44]
MRIISGTHKGKVIFPDKNFRARPTTDFAKENLFNVLNNYIDIEGAVVLDLFSGTGSISYEFASRGAERIVSVELNYNHYSFIKKTIVQLGFKNINVFKTDVFIACKKLKGQSFDIIFADPPYDLEKIMDIPAAIFDNELLAPDGLAIIEHPGTVDFSSAPFFSEHRQYGSVNFSIFRK